MGGGGVGGGGYGGGGISSNGAVGGGYGAPSNNVSRSMSGAMSNRDMPTGSANLSNPNLGGAMGATAPLMAGAGNGVGDTSIGSHQTGPAGGEQDDSEGYAYKAKALYACKLSFNLSRMLSIWSLTS